MNGQITAQEVASNYYSQISALNPTINPSLPGSDFWAKGQAIGNLVAGIQQNIYLVQQQLFVQTCSGSGVDKQLASWGQIPRMGPQPAVGVGILTTSPSSNFTIPAGTTLTYSQNNQTFIVQQDTHITIVGGPNQQFPIESQSTGSGIQIPNGSTLTFSSPVGGFSSATSGDMTDGSDTETDLQCISRLLTAIQQPRLGGTVGDYETWALSINGVTGAKSFPNLFVSGSLTVIILAGGSDYDVILETPASSTQYYSRTANFALVGEVTDYIQTQRPAGANVVVSTTTTQFVPSSGTISVQVLLANGLELTTVLPSVGSLTVEQLIQREVRRAIITTPLNGTEIDNTSYILLSTIEQVLDIGLSAGDQYSGIYASILLDRTVTYDGGNNNIPLNNNPDTNGNYPFIYDVLYSNIVVTTYE